MSDTETASWIAALERARTELERALSADEHWRALRGAVVQSDRAGHERVLAGNPVYCCWEQLNQTIEELRRKAQDEATAARRRVSLRDVLERIRSDAGLCKPAIRPSRNRPERGSPADTDRSRVNAVRSAGRRRAAGGGGGDGFVRDPRAGAAGGCRRTRWQTAPSARIRAAGGAGRGDWRRS